MDSGHASCRWFHSGPWADMFPIAAASGSRRSSAMKIMPDLARRFVSGLAPLFWSILRTTPGMATGGSLAALRLAQSRAIETRRNLLRVTNTGVTSGQRQGRAGKPPADVFRGGHANRNRKSDETTYYVRFGDWFALGASLALSYAGFIQEISGPGNRQVVRPFAQPAPAVRCDPTVSPRVLIDVPSALTADGLQIKTMFSCSVMASWRGHWRGP